MDPVTAAGAPRPFVSIVIPVLHDTEALATTLASLGRSGADLSDPPTNPRVEILVVNGGPADAAMIALEARHPHVRWLSSRAGRGHQMNAGAAQALGRWLVFLHADTQLSGLWLDEIARVDADGSIVGGSFRFQLDSSSRWARAIEIGVGARVRWLNLPYGDQALFVRHDVFRALGGYAAMPLMEDVDFVRRLRRMGRLYHSPRPVRTSARRWETDGWIRRSVENVLLTLLFLSGVSPSRLARRYRRARAAVAIMARAPSDQGGKTRLAQALGPLAIEESIGLRRALVLDTIESARSVPNTQTVLVFTPAGAAVELASLAGATVHLFAQRGDDLGERMQHAFDDLFAAGYSAVALIGSDLPTLPASYIARAIDALLGCEDPIVLGPADDGGYYLIGLRSRHPEFFRGITWGAGDVLAATRAIADAIGLPVTLVPAWYDVDTAEDFRRAIASRDAARHTREWAALSRRFIAHG